MEQRMMLQFNELARRNNESVMLAVQQAILSLQQQQSAAAAAAATQPHPSASTAPSALGSASSPPSFASRVPLASLHVQLAKPPMFTGQSGSRVRVDQWLFSVEQYCDATGLVEDGQRISFAASYMQEAAYDWWYNRKVISVNAPTTWEDFKTQLKLMFQPLAASEAARAALYHLKQGQRSVSEYVQAFYRQLHLISDMSEADKLFIFKKGLSADLFVEVDRRECKTLQEAMSAAQMTELRLNTHRRHGNHYTRPYSNLTSAFPASSSSSSSSSTPSTAMELGNIEAQETTEEVEVNEDVLEEEYKRYLREGLDYEPVHIEEEGGEELDGEESAELNAVARAASGRFQRRKPLQVPGLTKEKFFRLRNAGLCLRCEKPGHFARDCPLRPGAGKKANFQ